MDPVPALGEHSVDVMRRIGLDDDAIAELIDAGVIGVTTERTNA